MEVASCPSPLIWQRYVLGLVEEADQQALESHLETCPACLERLGRVPAEDTLVANLRGGLTLADEPLDAAVDQVIRFAAELGTPETLAPAGRSPAGEALDFLAPPREAGEIGRLAQFRVLRLLGRGGMGMVFLAEDTALRRRVALKVLRPDFARRPDAAARFLREARAAAALHHDHVVTIYQVGEADGPAGRVPFLAMELLEGVSLETALTQQPPALVEVVRIGREVAAGLAAAHQSGLIHRDVKPDNIWLEGEGGRVKLLDFGLARAAQSDARLTEHGVVMGTPAYMAPEQAAGQPIDGRADLFSLGCVLYRLCTGRLPFAGDDVMAVLTALATQEPAPVRQVNPAVPPALADLIHRLLAKARADRPASALAVVSALREVEKGLSPPAPRRRGWNRRRAILAGVAVLALVVGVALLRPWDGRTPTGEGTEQAGGALVPAGPAEAEGPAPYAVGPGDGSGYTMAWREDFENVPPGQFPAEWVRANNAWMKGSGVEEGQAAQGKRCLRLFGSLEKVFSADVMIPLPPRVPFTLRFWIRQGDEPTVGNNITHAIRGVLLFGLPKASDEEPRRAFVHADGFLALKGKAAPLAAHRWREVVIRFDRVGSEDVCTYWVDAGFLIQGWDRSAEPAEPTQLWLMAMCGSLWFDDVQLLYDPDTPQDRAVTAAWLSALRQIREPSGPEALRRLRAFAEQYRSAPALRHRQLAQAVAAQLPGDIPGLRPAATLPAQAARIGHLAWAPDGQTLASTAEDGSARLWRRDGTLVRQLGLHPGVLSGLAFAPDGRRLATAGRDGVLRVYRTSDGEEVQTVQGQVGPLRALAWAPDGRLLTGGRDGAVRAWDLAKGKPVEILEQQGKVAVNQVQLSADGRRRLVTVEDGDVFLDGKLLSRPKYPSLAALAPDGTRVAGMRSLWELVVWDTATRREVLTLPNDFTNPRIAWTPDGRRLAIARGRHQVEVRDAATGKEVARLPGRRANMALAFAPDGQTLATGDHDGVIRLWDLRPLPPAPQAK